MHSATENIEWVWLIAFDATALSQRFWFRLRFVSYFWKVCRFETLEDFIMVDWWAALSLGPMTCFWLFWGSTSTEKAPTAEFVNFTGRADSHSWSFYLDNMCGSPFFFEHLRLFDLLAFEDYRSFFKLLFNIVKAVAMVFLFVDNSWHAGFAVH